MNITTTRGANRGTPVTASVQRRQVPKKQSAGQAILASMSPEKRAFATQLQMNAKRRAAITAATNTSNIMARPDFLELLPLFVQNLLVLDVFGSVAMKSRQQLIPYFKFIAENTKGETAAGTVLNSPFVNRQGVDPNFTGRVVRNEIAGEGTAINGAGGLVYTPVLPGTVTFTAVINGASAQYVDNGDGALVNASGAESGYIDYSNGVFCINGLTGTAAGDSLRVTYQYDNETVGPDADGKYGAKMGKGHLELDEINLRAEAHQLACYWSVFSAFAAQQEYGANIGDMAKEAAFGELTAEINHACFAKLLNAAKRLPEFNWDASPILTGAVVPSDYLNMFKLKLNQAAASIYQRTQLTMPNRLIVGTNVGTYVGMVNGFKSEGGTEHVGPYKLGALDQFEVYVDPNYNPDVWVMACKSQDIRRNSALFGEYMPLTNTDAIGLADASVQQGYATMYASEVINPDTVACGRILGVF